MPITSGNDTVRSYRQGVCELDLRLDIGATGAVGATSQTSGATVTRLGVGHYRIVLDEKINELLAPHWILFNQSTPKGGTLEMDAELATNDTVEFIWVSDAGAAEEIASGDKLYLTVRYKGSSGGF